MRDKEYLITIFTPTYNRAYILTNLYNSLKNQINKNFEWVIVDDGSTDNTETLINDFIDENIIPIVYYKKLNQGKHIAINKGVELAKCELFFIVDSDDYLLENATDTIERYCPLVFEDNKLAGISFRRGYNKKKYIGTPYCFKDCVKDIFEFRYKMKIKGDMAEVYKTKVLINFPFPYFENEKFCAESLIWNRIGNNYKFLWTSKIIYICNYLRDGLTSKIVKLRVNSHRGSMLYYSELEKYNIPLYQKIKANINFWRFYFHSSQSFFVLNNKVNKILSIVGIPIGFLSHIIDKRKL